MTTSTRRVPFTRAIAIGIAVTIAAGPCWAAVISSNTSETGWQGELVNRPGCWTGDYRVACKIY